MIDSRTLPLVAAFALVTLLGAAGHLPDPARAQVAGCRWERAADDLPIGVYDAGATLDPDARQLYVQGGRDRDGVVRDDIWSLGLDTYEVQRLVSSGARATRWGHSLTWVRTDAGPRLYLMGGTTSLAEGATAEKRVYVFDPGERSWRIEPMSGVPSIQEHAAAYDPESGRIVLHGGCPGNGRGGICEPQTETFIVDVAAGEVLRGQRDGPALSGHSMVYDPDGRRMLLFGGTWDGRRGTDEVYALDLKGGRPENAVWQPLEVSGTRPERRFNHGAVYDSARKALLVFGGLKVSGEALDDLWALDLSTPGLALWRDLALPNQKRSGMVMSYDEQAQVTLLVSGGRPLADEASRDVFLLRCNRVPTATPPGGGTPVIGPTSTRTVTPVPVTPSPTIDPGTNVPPPITVPPGQTDTPSPPPATTAPPETKLPPPVTTGTPGPQAGRAFLPWLGHSAYLRPTPPSVTPRAVTATPTPATPTPATPTPGTPLACTSVEREPNDRLLQSLDWPPLCEGRWASGSLPEGDPGDYLRIRLERAGRATIRLEDIPEGRDYDLLLYDFAGVLLDSSQLPRDLDEQIEIDLAAEEYVIRVYPSTGRSELAYRLRWSLSP